MSLPRYKNDPWAILDSKPKTTLETLEEQVSRLRVEKAKLVKAHRAITLLQGNMYLSSVDRINTISYGKDRATKLREAIEISLTVLTKVEPTNLMGFEKISVDSESQENNISAT